MAFVAGRDIAFNNWIFRFIVDNFDKLEDSHIISFKAFNKEVNFH